MDSYNRDPLADAPAAAAAADAAASGLAPRNRDSLFLMARLQFTGPGAGPGGGTAREVRVRNLSEGGMMAEVGRVVEIGTTVTLDLRGIGEVPGKVAWCTEGRVGIAFDWPIDPQKARKPVGQGATTPVYATPMGLGAYRRTGSTDPSF